MAGRHYIPVVCILIFFAGCKPAETEPALFEVLDSKRTGLDFRNDLSYNQEFNLFKYLYFYNGSGIGAGDFNNDGLIDLFFGSNQQSNKLFLNTGNLHFNDVTKDAKIPEDGGWTTGISVVDIDNDGLLDIYVCRVGQYETLKSKNQVLVCQGIDKNGVPTYIDKAEEYGLDFSGFSTQAAFFDYDRDGDLDMYLLNHSVHQNSNYRARYDLAGTYHPLAGDRIYRNDLSSSSVGEGQVPSFTDVTRQTGINSTAIGYGLGIAISDINLDGYPDIYIGNDFHENDYLYINQKNGTFKEEGEQRLMHTSRFSMGVDVADMNNDAFPEIISMDMQPADPYILKRSLGEDDYDIFNGKISLGYSYQYTRNNFQLNRRNGLFSETGLYSGIAATDWSWAPLWVDFDNDGWKDLFISNGIPKRLNDIDYINFVSHSEVQQKINENNMKEKDIALIKKFPEIKLPNKFYRNNADLSFIDEEKNIKGDQPTFSNGAIYADLDNDGDNDIVVNNIDAPALVYENKSSLPAKRSSLEIKLKGSSQNVNAVGARLIVYTGNEIRTYEKFPAKGFMSSMETPLLIGLNKTTVDSIFLVWPDNTFQRISFDTSNFSLTITWKEGLPLFDYAILRDHYTGTTAPMTDITKDIGVDYLHRENHFVEFDREPLIPHMLSSEGPALAIGDINNDGLEDFFIGASRGYHNAIFVQQKSGKFQRIRSDDMFADSLYEDIAAVWTDVNNDKYADLVIASGGNEYYGPNKNLLPRVYLNDGKANFKKLEGAFTDIFISASCVVPNDFNNDGFTDLFIAGRAVPWAYGQSPPSYLLQNDGTGRFRDVTGKHANELRNAGMVTDADWFDIDKDGDMDLTVCSEWGGIYSFINHNGAFTKKALTEKKGWWNFILPFDADGDGDMDLVAGNLGLNSRLKASEEQPVRMYYNDFDDNGKKEQVITYYLSNQEIPFANKEEIIRQIPPLKKKFLYAKDFANSSLEDIFSAGKLRNADKFEAGYFSNAILINDGSMNFTVTALPAEAQLTSYRDAIVVNANNDKHPDIFLAGNYYDNNIQMGRYDADFGTLLVNTGNNSFTCESINGAVIRGQVRRVDQITIAGEKALVLAKNNDSLRVITFKPWVE
jgi:hypothetical protein